MNQSARPLSPRRVARAVIITIALVALAWLLWQARNLLFVLFFGVLVSLFLSVFVDLLTRLGLPRVPALLLVVVVLAGLLVTSAMLLWPTVRDQLSIVGRDVPEVVEQAESWLEEQYDGLMQAVGKPTDEVEETLAITVSPMTAVWVVLLFVGVQQIEGNLITPLVMRGAIQLPPALTVLFLSFMAMIFGFLGLFLAVPVLATVMVLVQTLYVEPLEAHERTPADPEGS